MAPSIVTVTVENLAPNNGNFLTPVWVGFHDGRFDSYDGGASLDGFPGTESLAEDGATEQISSQFESVIGPSAVQGTILPNLVPPGPFAPGTAGTQQFVLESTLPSNRYFSYASMIIPSNDAFIANGSPLAHPVFDAAGNFIGAEFLILGSEVNDAGTEVNDELPANTAFFGQAAPNTGVAENGVVTDHPGFNPPGSGGILDAPRFANANFTAAGYQIARITVSMDEIGNSGNESVVGTSVAQSIFGLAGDDAVFGLEGNDIVNGNQGQDNVNGNQGNDIVYGGQGNDTVRGGQGNDIVSGDVGDDQLFGDKGEDFLVGGAGNDNISGGEGGDFLAGGSFGEYLLPTTLELQESQEVPPVTDTAATGSVDVTVTFNSLQVNGTFSNLSSPLTVVGEVDSQGNPASSVHIHFGDAGFTGPLQTNLTVTDNGDGSGSISGSLPLNASTIPLYLSGNLYVNLHTENNPTGELRAQIEPNVGAATGNDTLSGQDGDDGLIGSRGNDVLDGGAGNDSLTGFTGNDTFVLAPGSGSDLILDFENGVDSIRLDGGLTFADLTVAQGTSTDPSSLENQNHTLIRVTATNEILAAVAFVSPTVIDSADFI